MTIVPIVPKGNFHKSFVYPADRVFRVHRDKAFDYGREEVRAYHTKLVKELIERYDFDGLELDWMRFGFHFRPGYESIGIDFKSQQGLSLVLTTPCSFGSLFSMAILFLPC